MKQEVVDNLIRGRERLAKGWCKNAVKRGKGDNAKYCLLGAIYCDTEDTIVENRIFERCHGFLQRALLDNNYPIQNIVHYNNVVAKSQDDVVSLMDKAICLAMGA